MPLNIDRKEILERVYNKSSADLGRYAAQISYRSNLFFAISLILSLVSVFSAGIVVFGVFDNFSDADNVVFVSLSKVIAVLGVQIISFQFLKAHKELLNREKIARDKIIEMNISFIPLLCAISSDSPEVSDEMAHKFGEISYSTTLRGMEDDLSEVDVTSELVQKLVEVLSRQASRS